MPCTQSNNPPASSVSQAPLIICHIHLVTRGRSSTFGRWETSVAKQDWASNQEGEEGAGGGKVGPAGGSLPQEARPLLQR